MTRWRIAAGVTVVAVIAALLAWQPWSGSSHHPRTQPDLAGAPDCGVFVRAANSGGITAAGWSCFTNAMSDGRSARLRLAAFTTEGDPTFVTYTTTGNGAATVLTDARLDKYRGNALQTEVCRRPDPRPVARGMFLDCAAPMPLNATPKVRPIAEVFCNFAMARHLISAQLTTLADVRKANVGGPYPGLQPGKNMFPARPGVLPAAWCWTDDPEGTGGSPGPTWTLYVALATGESARFISTNAGTRPPSGPPSFP
ncbi:MAG: hypothetical protein QOG34_2576 [Frankiaceae bacterium]|jgi:hypothetical protein|nr:hypothetical protein [Frankiaceae bacterium]